jgi:hypothetical protein
VLVPDSGVKEMVAAVEKLIEKSDLYVKLTQTSRNKTPGFDWVIIKQKRHNFTIKITFYI